jgi:hypothetical protein
LFFIINFSFLCRPCHAEEEEWYMPFFVEGAAQMYAVPELFEGLIKPLPGFRAALGYEYKNIRLAVESGYTHIEGTNPFVINLKFYPLVLKAGYHLPIRWGFGLQSDLSFGRKFMQAVHYNDIIEIITESVNESFSHNMLLGARLYATYTIFSNSLKLYTGGGVDINFETDGTIVLPTIEAGLSVKPFKLVKFTSEKWQGRPRRNSIYFVSNSVELPEQYLSVLDNAGKRLAANPSSRLTLRAYNAPRNKIQTQIFNDDKTPALSAVRVRFCMEYLAEHYGISEERISVEYRAAGSNSGIYNCVDIILR